MRYPILDFPLLVLRILLGLNSDAGQKGGRLVKTLPEKDLEFAFSQRDGTVVLNLRIVLLSAEVNLISEE